MQRQRATGRRRRTVGRALVVAMVAGLILGQVPVLGHVPVLVRDPGSPVSARDPGTAAEAGPGGPVSVTVPGGGGGRVGTTHGQGQGLGPGGLPTATTCESAPDHLLIRYEASASPRARAAAAATVGGKRLRTYRLEPGLELIRTSMPLEQAAVLLGGQRGVASVEPDCIVHIDQTPNDPGFAQEWGLQNTGQTGGTSGADIRATGAWDVRTDASGVVVAVIDTGMQLNHPDLAANLWTNPGEVAGNGIDDDGNGYVDDVHGWDFVNNDPVPSDDNGHGTHVSGTIGARGNNATGVTGVAWTVKLMPLKAFDANGYGYTSSIIGALDYAVANGARVSNNSYSGPAFERAEYDAFVAAGAAGHLAIAAAGNDGVSNDEQPHYPAAYRLDTVVSVAATTDHDVLASFSDFGIINVDVAAPGQSITSTWLGSTYATLSGTSMATPHVVGLAALVVAANPSWTGLQIRDRILGTTRPVAALDGLTWTGGVIDAAAALSNAPTVLPPPPPAPTPITIVPTIDANPAPAPVAAPAPPSFPEPDVIESSPVDAGAAPRIVLDGSGRPNIGFVKNAAGVELLTLDNGSWGERSLTHAFDEFYWFDLAVDSAGTPTAVVQRSWSDAAQYSDPGIVLAGATTPTPTETRLTAACPDADTCFWDWTPAIAYDANGAAHVVFSRTDAWSQNAVFAPGGSAPAVSGTGLYYATDATGDWVVRRLTTDAVDGPPAIAVAGDGTVHVTVRRRNGSQSGLYDLTNEGGTWTSLELTDHVEDLWSSVGVDTTGAVHVVFSRPGFGLYYLRRSAAGAWAPAELIHDGEATAPDVALDPAGKVHVAFGLVDAFNTVAGVSYLTNATGGWVESAVAGSQGHDPSLAVDAAGHAHIAYLQAVGAPLGVWYATNATGSFVSSIARASSSEGGLSNTFAYATDAMGHHHVAMASRYGDPAAGLYYGTDLTGSWVLTRISSAWPTSVALALDTNGRPHVAFTQQLDPTSGGILPTSQWRVGYATNAAGTWKVETASAGPDFGGTVAIVLDAANQPQLIYPDAPTTHLLRARRIGTSWTIDTIFGGATNIREPSAILDGSGVLHVAIGAQEPGDARLRIEYIRGTTNSWTASSVTNGTAYRFNPSIARAADGTIWISDWTDDGQIWVHRHPTGGGWDGTMLESALGDSWPTLAIDRDGKVNVVWARGVFYGSSGCSIPECPAGPGLRQAVLDGGTWTTTKLSPYWQDALSVLAAGFDGSLGVAFLRSNAGLRSIELVAGKPGASLRLQAASDTGISAADGLTSATDLVYDVAFSRAVSGLAASDFTVTGTATGCVVGGPLGVGATYTVTVSSCSPGTAILALQADTVTDGSAVTGPAARIAAAPVVIDRTAPAAASVVAALRTGATLSGTALPVRLSWTGADGGGSGIAGYEVARSLDGSLTWTALSTGLSSGVLDLFAASAGIVRYRVRASDKAGNTGGWTYGPTLTPRLSQQTSTALRYHGAWSTATSTSYSSGSARYATAAGASATYSFTGRSIALITTKAPSRGKVKIYVNGTYVGTVDLYAAVRYRVVAWQRTWSTAGTRTVTFVVAGTAGRPRVDLDAVAVLR